MKIAVDARFVGPKQTGLGRYTEELLRALGQIDRENEYNILLNKEGFDYFDLPGSNFKKIEADFPWYSVAEQVKMPKVLKSIAPDLVHFCHFNVPIFYSKPFVVTIHDLIKDDFKGKESTTRSSLVYNLKHRAYRMAITHAIKKSLYIFTPSGAPKEKIVNRYNVTADKIFVTYEAADPRFAKFRDVQVSAEQKDYLQKKYGIKFPYLLYVGNAYSYKNLERLLQAMSKIDKSVNLVNPCARSIFYDRLKDRAAQMGLQDRVILPGFVDDKDLALVYKAAQLYVFPSLSEGFGLPLLEAQMAGLPVVASKAAPLSEIGGEGALYFDPYNVNDIANKINKALADENLRMDLVGKGFANSDRFSWEKTAIKTKEVYDKVKDAI